MIVTNALYEINKLLSLLKGFDEEFHEAGMRACQRTAQHAKTLVVKATPSNWSQARNAWKVAPLSDGYRLLNDAPHIGVLEMGSRPHTPPLGPLYRWALGKKKLDFTKISRTRKKKEKREKTPPDKNIKKRKLLYINEKPKTKKEREAMRFARMVQMKIRAVGTEPVGMVSNNWNAIIDYHQKAFEYEITQTFKKLSKP